MDEVMHHKKQQRQIVRVFGAFLVAYIFAWSPIVIVGFVFLFSGGSNDDMAPAQVFVIGFFCYLSNILFQPVLETLFISDFRTELRSVQRNIGEIIRTGTGAVIRKGSELSQRLSSLEFHSSLVDVSIVEPLPSGSRHSRFSQSPLRQTQSDSGFEEESQGNGSIILRYGSSKSLNFNKSSKKTRFEGSIEISDAVKHNVLASLGPIPESATLERGTTLSHLFDECEEQDESPVNNAIIVELSGSATPGNNEEGASTKKTSINMRIPHSLDIPEFSSSPDFSDTSETFRFSSSPDILSSPKAFNQMVQLSGNEDSNDEVTSQ